MHIYKHMSIKIHTYKKKPQISNTKQYKPTVIIARTLLEDYWNVIVFSTAQK